MGLLEKANARANHVWYVSPDQLDLQLERLPVTAVQDRNLVKRDAFLPQFQDAAGDECSLLINVSDRHQRRSHAHRVANSLERLWKLIPVVPDGCIGQHYDFRTGPVVRFQAIFPRVRVALLEPINVGEVSAPPCEYR